MSTEFRRRACFHMGTASEETPHVTTQAGHTFRLLSRPVQQQSGLTDTWLIRESPLPTSAVLLASRRRHAPRRVSATGPRAKRFAGRIPGAPTSLPGMRQEPAPLPRALSVLLQKHHGGGSATRAPFTPTGRTSGTELQHLKG